MSSKIPVEITDGHHTVRITSSGELVVAPLSYDETEFRELDIDDQVYNFYSPKVGNQFIITGILAFGDKSIGTGANATVVIYEASSDDSTTEDKILLKFEMGQNQMLPLTGLRIKVSPGKFINAKTDDDDVYMTIMGYYINKID